MYASGRFANRPMSIKLRAISQQLKGMCAIGAFVDATAALQCRPQSGQNGFEGQIRAEGERQCPTKTVHDLCGFGQTAVCELPTRHHQQPVLDKDRK